MNDVNVKCVGAASRAAWSRAGVLASGATLGLLLFACGGEAPAPAPASAPTPAPNAAPAGELAGASEAAAPIEAPLVEVAESCDVIVGGERRVERAMLHRRNEGAQALEVVGERRIKLDCPSPSGGHEGKIIAQLEAGPGGRSRQTDIVSWDVALEATAKPRVLKIEAAQHGPPPELNEEDAAELWPELNEEDAEEPYWEGEAAEAASEEPEVAASEEPEASAKSDKPSNKPKPVAALIEVRFNAGRLKWAELAYEDLANKRKKQVTLGPRATRKLAAGRYKLSVRYPETSTSWQDAGEFELEAGKQLVNIKMRETPSLRAQVVSAE